MSEQLSLFKERRAVVIDPGTDQEQVHYIGPGDTFSILHPDTGRAVALIKPTEFE